MTKLNANEITSTINEIVNDVVALVEYNMFFHFGLDSATLTALMQETYDKGDTDILDLMTIAVECGDVASIKELIGTMEG